MTDKEFEKQKRRLKRYIDKWFKVMGLGWFKVDMDFVRARDETSPGTAAKTTTHWQYRQAWIEWFIPSIADNDDDFLEGIVVHEFTHILIAPLVLVDKETDLPIQHEYATESLARAIVWAREAGEKEKSPRKQRAL